MLRCRNENVISETIDQYSNPPNVTNSYLYNAMIHPLTRMVIYGAIWYQGRRIRYNLSSKNFFIQVNRIVHIIKINMHVHFQK
jgi:hypothetical protein